MVLLFISYMALGNQLMFVTYFFIYVAGLKSLAQRIVKISLACLETGSHYLPRLALNHDPPSATRMVVPSPGLIPVSRS